LLGNKNDALRIEKYIKQLDKKGKEELVLYPEKLNDSQIMLEDVECRPYLLGV
jgi:predicted GIY-YIG superfamily endonuclease